MAHEADRLARVAEGPSEAAFALAFKRELGTPPGAHRAEARGRDAKTAGT
ncbi:hypothetical protein AB0910_11870 [Streptomyces sp. NPDC047002]